MDPTAPLGPLRTPGPVVALRILAWIQVGALGLFVLSAVLLAGFSSFGLHDEDELTAGFATLGVLAGVVLAVFGVLLVASVLVPTLLLRTGRRSRRTGALISLAVVEGVFVAVQLLWVLAGLTGRSPAEGVFPLLLAAVPVAVLVLALHPASRAWAATHPDEIGAWGAPPPGWGAPPAPPVGWGAQPASSFPPPPPPASPASPWARPD